MTHARLHIANHDLLQGLFPQTPREHIFSMNPFSAVSAKDCFLSSSFLFLAHLQLDSTDPVNKGYATSLYWTMPALFTTFFFSLFLRRGKKLNPILSPRINSILNLLVCLPANSVCDYYYFIFCYCKFWFYCWGEKNHSYRRKASIRPSKTITYLSSNMYIM